MTPLTEKWLPTPRLETLDHQPGSGRPMCATCSVYKATISVTTATATHAVCVHCLAEVLDEKAATRA